MLLRLLSRRMLLWSGRGLDATWRCICLIVVARRRSLAPVEYRWAALARCERVVLGCGCAVVAPVSTVEVIAHAVSV